MAALDGLASKGAQVEGQVNKATSGMSKGMAATSDEAKKLGPVIQNASYQVGDFAVQIASGQSAAIAFAQQFPQLAGGFGMWGAMLGATVAIGAAVAPMLLDLTEKAAEYEDVLDSLKAAQDRMNASIELAKMPMSDLTRIYGDNAQSVREMAKAQLQLNIAVGRGTLAAAVVSLADATEKYTNITSAWRSTAARAFDDIREDFGFGGEQAAEFVRQLNAVNRAATAELQMSRFQELVSWLKQAGIELEDMPPEMAEAAAAMYDVNINTAELQKLIEDAGAALDPALSSTFDWADAMAGVRSELEGIIGAVNALGGGAIANAAKTVELQALQAGKTRAQAARERKEFELGKRYEQQDMDLMLRGAGASSWAERMLISGQRAALQMGRQQDLRGLDIDAALTAEQEAATKRERAGSRSGGGSRSGRDHFGKSVIEIQQETEAFLAQADALARIATAGGDWERALEVIRVESELLTAAQRSGVELTPEVTAGIREMAEAYVDAEDRLNDMRDATERGRDAFRDFVGSVLDGADGMKQALGDLLKEMAKVQLQNAAMKSISAVGGGGFLGIVGSLLTPFGGGRATGGPVTAGTTYLVGEQGPELVTMGGNGFVTPNHALGGGSGGISAPVSITIDARGAVEGTDARVQKAVADMLPAIERRLISAVGAAQARGYR